METRSSEYGKFFRIGEIATLKIEENGGSQELVCIIAQISDVSCELAIMYDELSENHIGKEKPATLTAMIGYLQCECPVTIGKNSFEQTAFARFSGEAVIKIKRNYIRQDVLVPFLFDRVRGVETGTALVKERRSDIRLKTFKHEPCGEGVKVIAWNTTEEVLPIRMNLGGGGGALYHNRSVPPQHHFSRANLSGLA